MTEDQYHKTTDVQVAIANLNNAIKAGLEVGVITELELKTEGVFRTIDMPPTPSINVSFEYLEPKVVEKPFAT